MAVLINCVNIFDKAMGNINVKDVGIAVFLGLVGISTYYLF